jgi:hypothetical protein
MPMTDSLGQMCNRVVRVHLRLVQDADFNVFQAVRAAQRVYGKYKIYFQVATQQSVRLEPEAFARLTALETECLHGSSSPEHAELYARFGAQDFGSITAFVVHDIYRPVAKASLLGCGTAAPHQPSVILSRQAFDPWVLAHEVGHLLTGLGHSAGSNDLIRSGPAHTITDTNPVLTPVQLEAALRSPYCLPC